MQFLQTFYLQSLPVTLSLPIHNSICFLFHLLQTQYVLLPCVSSIVSGESCHWLLFMSLYVFISFLCFFLLAYFLWGGVLLISAYFAKKCPTPFNGGGGGGGGGSLMQWRLNVGTFNAISVRKKFCSIWNEPLFDISLRRYRPLVLPFVFCSFNSFFLQLHDSVTPSTKLLTISFHSILR